MVKFKLYLLIIGSLILSHHISYAQATLREAQRQAELLNYKEAIDLYGKAFEKKETITAARGLAESYRQLNDYPFAESWYAKVVNMEGNEPMDIFYYAEALRNNSKYAEAKAWYQKYRDRAGAEALPNLNMLIAACDSATIWMKSPMNFSFKLDTQLNTPESDWGAIPFKNGIVFTSDRKLNDEKKKGKPILYFDANNNLDKDIYGWTGLPYLKLFYTEKDGANWKEPQLFSNKLNGDFHSGPAKLSPDGKEIYFTRTRGITDSKSYTTDKRKRKDYTIKLEIYSSKYDENTNTWSEPQPFAYNAPLDYSVTDPCVSNDGKFLYFVSDMPGGQGLSDLYYCEKQPDGTWGKPQNLKELNTPGSERTPWFDQNATLYFSSNGRGGMGGLDIYVSKSSGVNTWSEPKNIGYPINTPQDDFNLVFAEGGKSGYLSSNRTGGVGMDDIYSFTKEAFKLRVDGSVVNSKTNQPISNAIVTLYNLDKKTNVKVPTDENGKFTFNLEEGDNYSVTVEKTDFITRRKDSLSTKNYPNQKSISPILTLDSIIIKEPIKLESIYYDFNMWDIRADASKELNKLVKMLKDNPTMHIELSSHTDSRGSDSYNLELSQKRAQSVVNYLISKGISSKRLVAKGYGETKPINKCVDGVDCTDEEFQKNRRTEFAITRY